MTFIDLLFPAQLYFPKTLERSKHINPTIVCTMPSPEQKVTCQEYSHKPRKDKLRAVEIEGTKYSASSSWYRQLFCKSTISVCADYLVVEMLVAGQGSSPLPTYGLTLAAHLYNIILKLTSRKTSFKVLGSFRSILMAFLLLFCLLGWVFFG